MAQEPFPLRLCCSLSVFFVRGAGWYKFIFVRGTGLKDFDGILPKHICHDPSTI